MASNRVDVLSSHIQSGLYGDIAALIKNDRDVGPEFVRLAWHSSGTFDRRDGTGGNKGTMDKCPEAEDPANAGLARARKLLGEVGRRYPGLSKSDLWAFASVEAAGRGWEEVPGVEQK
eukprot:TRINITY_DN2872_c0_g2_i3.p2 TRINITY_DN2872_c0_g2~~TRINITY_DN2872_c0_g2_i3.p2  ORF type:complete len:118 (+),score=26.32 TRINITY_DN2872_c0_g2_i3:77-430(+)